MKTKIIEQSFGLVILVMCSFLLNNCAFIKLKNTDGENLSNKQIIADASDSYFYVLHIGDKLWQLNNVNNSENSISGMLTKVDPLVMTYYAQANSNHSKKVHFANRKYARQTHIFADQIKKDGANVVISHADITKVEIYKNDPGKSAIIGASVTAVAIGGFLAIACNCPHVYIYDGEKYIYNNTLFTGASSATLERNDYQVMPDYFPKSTTYDLAVYNEDNEQQFTNQLELIVVEHDEKTKVVSDQQGNIYTIQNLQSPFLTKTVTNENLNDKLLTEDDLSFDFDNASSGVYADVFATFKKPTDLNDTKLILKVKNSAWSGFVYSEFSKLFGKYYDNWVRRNAKKPLEEVKTNMIKAGIPLVVSIKKGEEWVVIEAVDLVGDVAYNTLAIPIDKSFITGADIEIRIRSGFKFWQMDYIGIDFSKPATLSVQHLKPIKAADSNGEDYTAQLSDNDDQYMERVEKSNEVLVRFDALRNEGNRTIILHSKGYYLPMKKYDGKLDKEALANFKNEAGLSRYSKQLYAQYHMLFALVSI